MNNYKYLFHHPFPFVIHLHIYKIIKCTQHHKFNSKLKSFQFSKHFTTHRINIHFNNVYKEIIEPLFPPIPNETKISKFPHHQKFTPKINQSVNEPNRRLTVPMGQIMHKACTRKRLAASFESLGSAAMNSALNVRLCTRRTRNVIGSSPVSTTHTLLLTTPIAAYPFRRREEGGCSNFV